VAISPATSKVIRASTLIIVIYNRTVGVVEVSSVARSSLVTLTYLLSTGIHQNRLGAGFPRYMH
jgi:hypothetical protein